MDRIFFPAMLVALVAFASIDAVKANYSALFGDVLGLLLLLGWYCEVRLRQLANAALADITAQLRDINQEIGRD